MNRAKFLLLISILFISLLTGCQTKHSEYKKAVNGVLDLTDWNFSKDGIAPLNGQWEFYWNQQITPGAGFYGDLMTGYYPMPNYWTKYQGLKLPMTGYATYRIIIKLDQPDQVLSISFPEIYSEYAIWINGKLLADNRSSESKFSGYLCPEVYDFFAQDKQLELVVQIENKEHIYQGINTGIELGESATIHKKQNISFSIDFFMAAICLLSSLYHFTLFLFRKKNKELIYFSILCMVIFIRTILSHESILVKLVPDFPFYLGLKITTLTIPLCVIAMTLYTHVLYFEDIPKISIKIITVTHAVYALLIIISSWEIYFKLFIPYLFLVFLTCIYGFYIVLTIIRRRRQEYLFYASGNLFLALGTITDIIVYLCGNRSIHYVSYGMIIFVLIQIILIGRRYMQAARHVELLSSDLAQTTHKIEATEIAYLNAQMKPHFLYNTLNTIANYCHTEPREAEQLILYLAKYLRGTLSFENLGNAIPLHKELELISAYCYIQKTRYKNIEFETEVDKALNSYFIPPLILQPLVENAIKHGVRKNTISGKVIVRIDRKGDFLLCSVEDNGIGIAEEKLGSLFSQPTDKNSIGLYNIHQRLLRLYGKGLNIQSKEGIGTAVQFEIPIGRA